jgi:methionine--tRNA ligase beta chain
MISYDDFKKLDIRIGRIVAAERVPETDKLLKLEIDLGAERRLLVAGIAQSYEPGSLIGKEIPVLTNLEPRKIRGVESHGMILAADMDGVPVLMHPDKEVLPGSIIR